MTDVVHTMNVRNGAVSRYTHMPFTRIVRFKDKIIGLDPQNGLFDISTAYNTANGTAIGAALKSGDLDFGRVEQKRIQGVYMGYRCAGDVTVTLQNDEAAPLTYTIPQNQANGLTQRRVKTARGRRGRYWNFLIQNVLGAKLDMDNLELFIETLRRRI